MTERVLACNRHSRTAATRVKNLAIRHAAVARQAWIRECDAGHVKARTREAYQRWDRMAESTRRLRAWMDRDASEAAAALSLALDLGDIYAAPGDRSWRYVIRSLRNLADYVR